MPHHVGDSRSAPFIASCLVVIGFYLLLHIHIRYRNHSHYLYHYTSDLMYSGFETAADATNQTTTSTVIDAFRPMFEWSNLDTDQMAQCGNRKCFFRSRATGQSQNSSIGGKPLVEEGYLVAVNGGDYYEIVQRTWNITRRLEKENNMRHFLLEPPQKVALPSADVVSRLNSVALRNGKLDREYYVNSSSLVVQKVRVAPTPHLIPRCYFTERQGRGGTFFWHSGENNKEEFRLAAIEKERFMKTFEEELQRLRELLEKEDRLWMDFQFLVDPNARIHHIDIDRIESSRRSLPGTANVSAKCFNNIRENFEKVLKGK